MQGRRSNAGEPAIGGRRGVRARRRFGWSIASVGIATAMAAFALGAHGLTARAADATPTGDAYAVGTDLSGAIGSLLAHVRIAERGPLPNNDNPTSIGFNTPPNPLIIVGLLNTSVVGSSTKSTASSTVASVRLLPDAVPAANCANPALGPCDLLDATLLKGATQVDCNGLTSPFETSDTGKNTATVLTLTIAGNKVDIPGKPNVTVDLKIAQITLNHEHFDAAANLAVADAVVVHFPTADENGPLAALVAGDIRVAHAESDLEGCPPASKTTGGSTTPSGSTGGSSSGGVAGLPNTSSGSGFGLGAGVSILLLLAAPPAVIGARIARRRIRRHDQS